jgi:hypothetical protein
VAYFIPTVEGKVSRFLLVAPLITLGSVILLRFFLSPFLLYRRRDAAARTVEDELGSVVATLEETIRQQNETIRTLRDKPKRSAAEQHDYDSLAKALEMFKEPGVIALRHIRSVGTIAFGGAYSPTLPSGLTPEKALWVYRHCATEGLLNCTPNLEKTQEVFAVPAKMDKIFDDVLFPE